MNLQTAKIISAPSKSCWSQVYIEGDLLAVIKIEKEIDPPLRAKEIISCFHEYYASSQGRGLKKLEVTLERVQKEFGDLRLELVAGVVLPVKSPPATTGLLRDRAKGDFTWCKNVLYLSILNKGRVVLFREGNLVTILKGTGELITASGFLKENDLFLLGTERFFELAPQGALKASLGKNNPEEIVEVLAPVIHEKEENGGAAAVIVKAGTAERPKEQRLGKFLARFKSLLAEFITRPRPIYIPRREKREERKQRMTLTVAIILAGLLLISTVFGWRKKRKEEEVRRFNQFWEEIEYKYEQGKELVELNPIRARELLEESRRAAKERKDEFAPKNWQYQKLERIEEEAEKELEKVLREYELAEVPVFLDLNLIKKELKGINFDFWKKEVVVLGGDGTVVKIDLNRKAEIKGRVEGGKLVTLWGERAFVLNELIIEVGNKTKVEEEWEEVVALKAFAGNLYLMDKGGNKIFKIPAIESGFGAKRNWFGPGVEPDLTGAVDMAIDGDVWILKETGEILKFSRGVSKAFGISGLDQHIQLPAAFYTDGDCKKLYILDKGNKRIVVLDKSGEYDSQYIWEGIEGVSDIVVSESERKMLLLSKNKIYEIEIK